MHEITNHRPHQRKNTRVLKLEGQRENTKDKGKQKGIKEKAWTKYSKASFHSCLSATSLRSLLFSCVHLMRLARLAALASLSAYIRLETRLNARLARKTGRDLDTSLAPREAFVD